MPVEKSGMEAILESLLPHWPGVVFRQRPDLSFEFATPGLETLTGRSLAEWQIRPDLFWAAIHESDVDELKRRMATVALEPDGSTSHFRIRHAQTGRVAYISEFRRAQRDPADRVLRYEGFWLDETRLTLSERRLAAAAWKETLGLLTLGLAHDFNNVLAGILALSESFLSQIQPDHPFYEGLVLVKRNAQQAAQLVQRIAQLHRGKTGTRAYHNLNDIVKDGLDLLRKVIPKRIELEAHLDPASLPLYVDAVELQQVLINLALNSSEAMPERGKITIQTSQCEALPRIEHWVGELPGQKAAFLSVSDSGGGIKARHFPFLFDPFFTTKPMNRGSGLGLYNARLFVERHRGAISVDSTEGKGATFRVWLPLADFTEADKAVAQAARRRRSILLVGNPGPLLISTTEFLRQRNYHVVACSKDAEDILRSSDYQFDGLLVLLEPRDPIFSQLVQFVRQQRIPLKVIGKSVGCNIDELDPGLLSQADLVISSETPEDTILERLAMVFDVA
jgi:signal transduction histidine kinase